MYYLFCFSFLLFICLFLLCYQYFVLFFFCLVISALFLFLFCYLHLLMNKSYKNHLSGVDKYIKNI